MLVQDLEGPTAPLKETAHLQMRQHAVATMLAGNQRMTYPSAPPASMASFTLSKPLAWRLKLSVTSSSRGIRIPLVHANAQHMYPPGPLQFCKFCNPYQACSLADLLGQWFGKPKWEGHSLCLLDHGDTSQVLWDLTLANHVWWPAPVEPVLGYQNSWGRTPSDLQIQ